MEANPVQRGDPCLHGGAAGVGCQSQGRVLVLVASVREDDSIPHDLRFVIMHTAFSRHREAVVLETQRLLFGVPDGRESLVGDISHGIHFYFEPFRACQLLFVAIFPCVVILGAGYEDEGED